MAFERKEEKVDTSFTLSLQELKQLEDLVHTYGDRIKLLNAHYVIKTEEDGTIIVYQLNGAIGRKTGIGEHKYQTEYCYAWWIEAFYQLDKYLEKKEFAESMRIYNLTGEYPVKNGFREIRKSLLTSK